jgi:hypothetical protein
VNRITPRRPDRDPLHHEADASFSDTRLPAQAGTPIIKLGQNAWRRVHAADTGVLVDAADYYSAVYWAVSRAQSYVLMSGWQFDSGVPLLRGADVPSGADVRF